MFKKKKENNMTYFVGGTVVGMAAGLVVGKLLSSTSPKKSPAAFTNKNINKISQNDKNCNECSQKTEQSCATDSKSIPQHGNRSANEKPVSETFSEKLYNNFSNNINNLDSGERSNTKLKKLSYEKNKLHNISIEDNANCNLSDESSSQISNSKEKCVNYYLPKFKNIKELNSNVQLENTNFVHAEAKSYTKTNIKDVKTSNRKDICKHTQISENFELPKTFDSLSSPFYARGSTTYKDFQNIKSSMINPSMLDNYIENASHVATRNSTLHFEDEDEEKSLHSPASDDFCEMNLISSTKHYNVEDM